MITGKILFSSYFPLHFESFLFQVFVYEFSENGRRWIRVESLVTVNESVHDIAFAPNVGRSYQLLAIATNKDLRIISLKPTTDELGRQSSDQSSKYQVGYLLLKSYQKRNI